MNSFERFLKELAKVLQFNSLRPDEYGACLIVIKEGQVPLLFELDDQLVPNTILISSQIAPIPIEYRADVYEVALKENSLSEDTLSVKPDEDLLYIHRRVHPDIEEKDLSEIVFSLAEKAKFWRKKIDEITHLPPKTRGEKKLGPSIQIFPYRI